MYYYLYLTKVNALYVYVRLLMYNVKLDIFYNNNNAIITCAISFNVLFSNKNLFVSSCIVFNLKLLYYRTIIFPLIV